MRVFLDTSVLVSFFIAGHVHHERAAPWFQRIHGGELEPFVALHSAAEAWKVLTTLPVPSGDGGEAVELAMRWILEGPCRVLEPRTSDYRDVLRHLGERGLRGGVVYDALILSAARRSGAETILTFNVRDFARVAPDLRDRIRAP